MSKVYFSVLFLLMSFFSSYSQNDRERIRSDKNRFQKLLENEIEKSESINDSGLPDFSTLFPDRLPSWINHIPAYTGDKLLVIGASDPGSDYQDGVNIAKIRMLAVAGLLYKAQVGNLREFYTREESARYANAFMDYTRYQAALPVDTGSIKIIDEHITRFEEVILLGEIDLADLDRKKIPVFKTTSDIVSHARRSGNSTELIARGMLEIELDDPEKGMLFSHDYKTHAINKIVNTESRVNGQTIASLPAMSLKYVVNDSIENNRLPSEMEGIMGFSLRNGLWYAYLNAILFELAEKSYGNAINVSNVNDLFQDIAENLTRELVQNQVNCIERKMVIHDNDLYLICQ